MGLKEGFEESTKELKEFTQEQIEYFQGQGVSVDVTSHTAHSYKVFVLGKLHVLSERIEKLEKLLTTGEKNVKKVTTRRKASGSKKRASRKTKRSSTRQLSLEL